MHHVPLLQTSSHLLTHVSSTRSSFCVNGMEKNFRRQKEFVSRVHIFKNISQNEVEKKMGSYFVCYSFCQTGKHWNMGSSLQLQQNSLSSHWADSQLRSLTIFRKMVFSDDGPSTWWVSSSKVCFSDAVSSSKRWAKYFCKSIRSVWQSLSSNRETSFWKVQFASHSSLSWRWIQTRLHNCLHWLSSICYCILLSEDWWQSDCW